MMRQILFIAILFFSFNVSAQLTKRQAKDTLIWNSETILTKEDFKSKRSMYGREVPAYTSSAIYLYQSEVNGNFIVEAIFLKSQSYMRNESPYILKHEQTHFDLSELYARKLRKAIAETDFAKVKNTVNEMQKIYKKITSEWQKEQNRYDKETQHGINPTRQNIWNEQVAADIKALDAYASTEVSLVP